MKILFLVPYPLRQSPSQRFRFEQYFGFLSQKGIEFKVKTFLKPDNWRVFYSEGNSFLKAALIIKGFTERLISLFEIPPYDFIFIHREATPIGPPFFEWIIAKVFRKRIIYDFDDAIWLTDKKNESWIVKTVRWRSKVESICKWSYKVSAGNAYLAAFAKRVNGNVVINPTTVDTENVHVEGFKDSSGERIVIGWTGSHSTLKYLKELEPALLRLEAKFAHVDFWVIADKPPNMRLPRLYFRPWSSETEVSDLAQFDIGIMPLPDDEWTKGKCGFKALQYMAMEIPTVASAVGVNTTIISHGVNGFLVKDNNEWETFLSRLIEDKSLRKSLGKEGRKTLDLNYSVLSNRERFTLLFS
ncbi:MAG: glycosyltransferase family 4 protein [Bacteroidetes bacterium]|nr:glycosyltransferase family 4 protein [Bacteroidota bacterium]